MDIETLKKERDDLLLALQQVLFKLDPHKDAVAWGIVSDTLLKHGPGPDTHAAANAGGLSPGPAAGRELAGYFALQDGEWHPSNADDPCSVKLYKNARSPAALAAGQSAGTALGKALDKMEVIAQVVESERLTNTANALRGLIEQVRTVDRAPDTSAAGQWVSVADSLPEKYCLAVYETARGKQRIIRAMYVERFTIEATGDDCHSEINDENDTEYLREGWYELIDNWGEYSSVNVCEGVVTHWQPLPPLPSEADRATAKGAGGRDD